MYKIKKRFLEIRPLFYNYFFIKKLLIKDNNEFI